MNNQIKEMLLKAIQSCDCEDFIFNDLSETNKKEIITWYTKYNISGEFSTKEALELMLFFYTHENLDLLMNTTDFIQIKNKICKVYNIPKDKFLDMYLEFHQIIKINK